MGIKIKILKNVCLILTIVLAINFRVFEAFGGVILYSVLESVNEMEVKN